MQVFLETAVDSIVLIDARGLIQSFNPAAERMFGYARAEVLGENVSLLMPEPYRSEHDGYIASFLRTGKNRVIGVGREVEGRRKDGAVFPLHLSVAEFTLDGEVRFAGILRDLTQEREARAREADLARILNRSLNEIFIFDAETLNFVEVNDGARSNLGYSMAELLALTPLDIKPESTPDSFRELLRPLRDRERERLTLSTLHRRKDGSTYPVEIHLQLSSFAGRSAFVAIALDTTERDELHRELLHAQKLEAVGRMAGALAHDFNNLLMGVISGCQMASRMLAGNAPARDLLAEVQKEAQSGAGITRQLLDFSRKGSSQPRPCDLDAIVRGAEPMLGKLLGEDVELTLSLETQGATVLADPGKLEQILMNLVVNARDALPRGGRVDITVSEDLVEVADARPRRCAVLSVSDDGCGMDEETQSKAFEPFFTTKGLGQGTGLGLSTVFGLTQEFGGQIELRSAPGAGTTLRLSFPRTFEQAPTPEAAPAAPTPGGSETILIVEDAPLVRAGVRSLLRDLGYRVLDAPEPHTALELLAANPQVDLMLTDIVMPGMSGPDLARAARDSHPAMQVLFMSAFSDESLIEQGRLQSGMAVLEKPFDEHELARRVRELLAGKATS